MASVIMKNPLQDETAAFHLVLLSIAYCGLIALGSWINTWLGLAVFVVLSVSAVLALRSEKRKADRLRVHRAGDGVRRILVVANETVEGERLLEAVRERAGASGASVLVVAPALNSRLRTWTSDEDGAREAARSRLDASLARLAAAGVTAQGHVGDGDPAQAIEDALQTFPADEIVLSTHPPGRSNWLERGVVDAVRDRFDLPVTHVVVDLQPAATA